ncbi:MAG: hypothetical protein A2Z99_06610 [Treponema sp. GWB1_62_6]|nr:MAG: hypothetical protein A2Y36_07910 [Treponema sp. GWA1_62_8]OHE68047.1 MAG: hypothetical protein A2Z99_06610 [Treponema sp. GWB1_62_6]OHE68928.1 MAG: hypothetical protein A2413_07800 [Treponema sp. RIFOXYC1_FULL_61_9]HCM27389.1 hypothetical protein [Treponema sp.]
MAIKYTGFADEAAAGIRGQIEATKRLGTTMIRGMSFTIVRDEEPDSPRIRKLVVEKLTTLVRMCEEAGVSYLHENCMNFGGLSWEHSLRLVEAVKSPAFALIYDTGNPSLAFDRRNGRLQNSWEFYEHVKPLVRHVHIKDGVYLGPGDGIFPKARFTLPGEGDGDVVRIVEDLMKSGYDGFLSIEPHTATVYHEDGGIAPEEARMQSYVRYGKRLMEIAEAARL